MIVNKTATTDLKKLKEQHEFIIVQERLRCVWVR